MATIRVPQREHAIRMKQSLSIAKITSGAFKMEIIQDFGEETTLGKNSFRKGWNTQFVNISHCGLEFYMEQ